jgi:hypothetical protein
MLSVLIHSDKLVDSADSMLGHAVITGEGDAAPGSAGSVYDQQVAYALRPKAPDGYVFAAMDTIQNSCNVGPDLLSTQRLPHGWRLRGDGGRGRRGCQRGTWWVL